MAGQIVLITGCSAGGLGFSLCEEFARRGCKVYATARDIQKMQGLPTEISQLELDVTKDEDVRRVVKEVLVREGHIDILVNNAGAHCCGALLDVPLGVVKQTFETNFYGVLRMVQAVVPSMAAVKQGLVINIGSVAGYTATAWAGTYSSSKAATNSLSDTLDMELRPLGVRVLLVALGSVRSNIAVNGDVGELVPPGSLYERFRANVLGRLYGSQTKTAMPPEEAARLLVDAALKPTPPQYMAFGGDTTLFWFLRWVPRSLALTMAWNSASRMVHTQP